MLILAIDLGKRKSVFCLFDTNDGEHCYGDLCDLDQSLPILLQKANPDLVVFEICPLAAKVHDLVAEQKIKVIVADTTQDAWKWKNVKRKTDHDDALKLARLAALKQLNPVHIPSPPMRAWRQLVAQRNSLVAEQTRCKNRIRALLLPHDQDLPSGKRGWTKTMLEELWSWARPLEVCSMEELWRGVLEMELQRLDSIREALRQVEGKLDHIAADDQRIKAVETIPGVGRRTAEVIVTAIDDASRFKSRRQVSSYGGLVPRRYQSGEMDRQGRISKRGAPHLRQALNQAAWAAVRYSPDIRSFYLRLTGGGRRRKKQALVAVMRKLLVIAWALMRDRKRYATRSGRLKGAAA